MEELINKAVSEAMAEPAYAGTYIARIKAAIAGRGVR